MFSQSPPPTSSGAATRFFAGFSPPRASCSTVPDSRLQPVKVRSKKNAARPAGEWNHMKVTCKGNRITVILNNEIVNDVPLDYRTIKDRPPTGYIGFQDHGLPLWLRNIRVREL